MKVNLIEMAEQWEEIAARGFARRPLTAVSIAAQDAADVAKVLRFCSFAIDKLMDEANLSPSPHEEELE